MYKKGKRRAIGVVIVRADGKRVDLSREATVYASRFADTVELHQVPAALADPAEWIEYDTVAVWDDET